MQRVVKGQSIFEYAMILTIVVASLVTMKIYMKRAIEGRLRGSMDEIGELYSPLCVTSKFTTEQLGETKEIELFGLNPRTNEEDIGISVNEVLKTSEIVRSATGDGNRETITIDFKNDPLFEP